MNARLEPRLSPRPLNWGSAVYVIQEALGTDAANVYLVGGCVRDAFWGYTPHDIDLAVAHDAFRIARKIANALDGSFYKLDPARETGRAIVDIDGQRTIIDVASFRGDDLLTDLEGRDFTLNAVAAPLAGHQRSFVIDPLDGLQDAQRHILRRCSSDSLTSDPIRALRAVRMSVRFRLRIEPETLADIRQQGPRLAQTSPERIRDEFMTLLDGLRPAAALRALDALGLLELVIPEITAMRGVPQSPPHQFDVWTHTLQTVEQLDRLLQTISPQRTDSTATQAGLGMVVYYLDRHRPHLQDHIDRMWPNQRSHRALLLLGALLHDSGKPASLHDNGQRIRFLNHESVGAILAGKRGTALRLSKHEIDRLQLIVRNHMRPHLLNQETGISRRAIYRFWRDCGPAGVDICLLALADYLATVGPTLSTESWSHYLQTIDTLLDGYYTPDERNVTTLPILVTGHDLIEALNLKPGPHIGEILELIREAQAAGEIQTSEEALDLARRL